MEKGQILTEIQIEDISQSGEGIGRYQGMAVFIPGAMPGDIVSAEIVKQKKSYAIGRLIEITALSPDRIPADCEYFGSCGGCTFRSISYEAELALKEKQVRDKLMRLSGIKEPNLKPIIGMKEPLRYRNKAQFPVRAGRPLEKDGRDMACGTPYIGFYARSSHELTDIDDCLLQNRVAVTLAEVLKQFMREMHITAWDEKRKQGLLRHLIVKTAESTGEVMVILVINGKEIPQVQKLVEMLDDAAYEAGYSLESVILNINQEKTSCITGEKYITIAGKETIFSECMGLKFEISPAAFYQINTVQTEVLYSKVMEYAALSGSETVFDLYCGIGTIGLIAADQMREKIRRKCGFDDYENMGRVYGIEAVKGAVIDANRNAVINHLVNAEFIYGKAEEKIGELLNGYTDRDGFFVRGKNPDIVIIDPPRSGCDGRLLTAVMKAMPQRIVYVSCDPATLARDAKLLGEHYELVETTPVDMFPRCNNIETVSLFMQHR